MRLLYFTLLLTLALDFEIFIIQVRYSLGHDITFPSNEMERGQWFLQIGRKKVSQGSLINNRLHLHYSCV